MQLPEIIDVMKKVYLSLGTNLGNRRLYIVKMEMFLREILSPPFMLSRLMETEPVGTDEKQQWFYNRIFMGHSIHSPDTLLTYCLDIEKKLGRVGKNNLKARTADIDILFIENTVISNEKLIIPHHKLLLRRFCMEGMYEIAPEKIHPIENRSFKEIFSFMPENIRKQRIIFIDN
jgi:2-amino-4-hydroxy-6-hydroxymethyldihydropteridine diphosphokinase